MTKFDEFGLPEPTKYPQMPKVLKMNQRIKELKKQAWEYAMAVHDGYIVPPPDKEVWPIDKVLDEKFAELIVRECMEVASPNYMDTPEDSAYYVELAIDRIADHFGVEE
jgi:hypothetical protein